MTVVIDDSKVLKYNDLENISVEKRCIKSFKSAYNKNLIQLQFFMSRPKQGERFRREIFIAGCKLMDDCLTNSSLLHLQFVFLSVAWFNFTFLSAKAFGSKAWQAIQNCFFFCEVSPVSWFLQVLKPFWVFIVIVAKTFVEMWKNLLSITEPSRNGDKNPVTKHYFLRTVCLW